MIELFLFYFVLTAICGLLLMYYIASLFITQIN